MGKVTDELVSLISKQVQDRGIVVWYDPDHDYAKAIESLDITGGPILAFRDSFLELRHRIEPFVEFIDEDGQVKADPEVPPKLVVYVPFDRRDTQSALVEVEAAGVVVEPGADHWHRNTRLKVLAERVFKRVAPDRAAEIAKQVDDRTRSLEELDWLADQTGDLGAVKLIFGTTVTADVTLLFASSAERDAAIEEKAALPEIADLLRTDLGVELQVDAGTNDARRALCRTLLLCELATKCAAAGHEITQLETAAIPASPHHRQEITKLCETWRNRVDLREAYVERASHVAAEVNIANLKLPAETVVEIETFPSIENLLLTDAEAEILSGDLEAGLSLARRRRTSFWAIEQPTNQLRWSLLETICQLLLAADHVEAELKVCDKTPAALVRAYAGDPSQSTGAESEPWYLLDTFHRHLERQYATFDLDISGAHDELVKVIAAARQRYMDVATLCAEAMTNALESADFVVAGFERQSEIFARHVGPRSREEKTAYLLVDALRYEMGVELVKGLGEGYDVDLFPALAQLPSVTEVGMSAVLPNADTGMQLVKAGAGRVAIQIGDQVMTDRSARIAYLESHVPSPAVVAKPNELQKPSKKLRDAIGEAQFVLVTSQEIDWSGEKAKIDVADARRYMDSMLDELRKCIRRLAALGVKHIIVVADHGYLFAEELDTSMKVDPPGGKTAKLHRRVWIGQGGDASTDYIRLPAGKVGLGGDLELAFPRGLGCFTSAWFFHGGTSLQEMVIPVALIQVNEEAKPEPVKSAVDLSMDKSRITNRLFTIVCKYAGGGLFAAKEKRVKVLAITNKQEIGAAATAAYGFEDSTQEIVLQQNNPNAITVMLTGHIQAKTVTIQVLDVVSQVELASLKDVPVDLAE